MSRKSASGSIDKALEDAVAKLLKDTMGNAKAELKDKCAVIDRALKLQAIKAKMNDGDYGSGFKQGDDDGDS